MASDQRVTTKEMEIKLASQKISAKHSDRRYNRETFGSCSITMDLVTPHMLASGFS
jgi:hypothetical protein